MAKVNGEATTCYGRLLEAHKGIAPGYLDRSMVFYALELLGTMPPGSARRQLLELTETAVSIDMILHGFKKIFDGQDALETACALLDYSAARACGPRSRDAGVFYTPMPIARYICKHAIGSYILHRNSKHDNALKDIRIFDSSCGSGIFLQAALEELYRLRVRALERAEVGPDIKKDIVENNLYGMDVERHSADVAALRLRLLLAGSSAPEKVKTNVICENALFIRSQGPFDVIVGNPPYMRIKSMFSDSPKPEAAKMKKGLAASVRASRLYRCQEGNLNLYKLFIERNLSFLRDGGSMGLIIPSSFLNEATSEKLRRYIFDTCSMEEVIEFPERSRIFHKVNQATAVLVLNKSKARGVRFKLRSGISAGDLETDNGSISIGYEELERFTDGRMEVPLLRKPYLEWDMMRRLKGIPPFKGGSGVPQVGHITVGNVDETLDKAYISEEPTGDIIVKGIHLKEYSVDLSPEGRQPRWVKKAEFLRERHSALPMIAQWRIIGRNTQNKACARRLKFALLPPGYLCSNSIKQILVTDKNIEPLYLLGLLNSSTMNWYFELFCSQNNIRNYRVEALPIVRAQKDVQAIFARVSRLVMSSEGNTREFMDRVLMDSMVFELYFLDDHGLIDLLEPLKRLDDATFTRGVKTGQAIGQKIKEIMADERYSLIKGTAFKETYGQNPKNISQRCLFLHEVP